VCGGCSLQHLESAAQVRAKQEVLLDTLQRIGGVRPKTTLVPLTASHWGYRRKARLGVKYVEKKGRVLVGFRERSSAFVTELTRCEVLHPRVGECLDRLSDLLGSLTIRDQVPQVEVSMGDEECALVFRVLKQPMTDDLQRLSEFGRSWNFKIHLQPGGPESIYPLPGHRVELSYTLPSAGLRVVFEPLDFTQVNAEINRLMVDQALDLLELQPDDQALDLFCGVGNFTLPLATRSASVLGVEGDASLVERARANAAHNGLGNVQFQVSDLSRPEDAPVWTHRRFDKVILDPPRSGAYEVLRHLPRIGVQRAVYVSCYPSTLARDAGRLVSDLGYRLVAAGVMDMFPHTGHLEAMALFESQRKK